MEDTTYPTVPTILLSEYLTQELLGSRKTILQHGLVVTCRSLAKGAMGLGRGIYAQISQNPRILRKRKKKKEEAV